MEKTLLSRNIRLLRRRKGLTQEDFASLIGTPLVRVVHIECGEEPTSEEVSRICDVLQVPQEQLRSEIP